jgi:hypothetical protein
MSPESCWIGRKGSITAQLVSTSRHSTRTRRARKSMLQKRTCNPCCCCDSPSSPCGKETPLIFPPARMIHHSVNLATHPLSPSSSLSSSSFMAAAAASSLPFPPAPAARFSFSRFLRLARFASSSSVLLHRRTTTLRSEVWRYSSGICGFGWKVRWVIGFVVVDVDDERGRMEVGRGPSAFIKGLSCGGGRNRISFPCACVVCHTSV